MKFSCGGMSGKRRRITPATSSSLYLVLVSMLLVMTQVSAWWGGDDAAEVDDSEELMAKYPLVGTTERKGNPKILCPFLRMLERSGRLDDDFIKPDDKSSSSSSKEDDGSSQEQEEPQQPHPKYRINNDKFKEAAKDFGCAKYTGCGPVIDLVSHGQRVSQIREDQGATSGTFLSHFHALISNPFYVDLERLWAAPPISHACGFTFEKPTTPGEPVHLSEERIKSTLEKFSSKQDKDGRLTLDSILEVKEAICAEEGVEMTIAGKGEAKLIFSYLGGLDREFVDFSDVERFLKVNNQLPLTKAEENIGVLYNSKLFT